MVIVQWIMLLCDQNFCQWITVLANIYLFWFRSSDNANCCTCPAEGTVWQKLFTKTFQDISEKHLQMLISFMYRGEINCEEHDLPQFIAAARWTSALFTSNTDPRLWCLAIECIGLGLTPYSVEWCLAQIPLSKSQTPLSKSQTANRPIHIYDLLYPSGD